MKKFFIVLLSFFALLFLSTSKVEAKSDTKDGVTITFGEDLLYMQYTNINKFKVSNYKFYYNGIEHEFDTTFEHVDTTIDVTNLQFTMENETFTLANDHTYVTSAYYHETYQLPVVVDIPSNNTKTYTFTQELCYTYDTIDDCSVDSGDVGQINASDSFLYYYAFLPFYEDTLRFDLLSYNFTLDDGVDTYVFSAIGFTRDEIVYEERFTLGVYGDKSQFVYDNKTYVKPYSYSDSTVTIRSLTMEKYIIDTYRMYRFTIYICVGDLYENCSAVKTYDTYTKALGIYSEIPLSNITYDSENKTVNYDSFKMKASYVCIYRCNSRAQTALTYTNEEVYYLKLSAAFNGALDGKVVGCGSDVCYGLNRAGDSVISYEDSDTITHVYYLISDTWIDFDDEETDNTLINNEITNGGHVAIDKEDGLTYLYTRTVNSMGSEDTFVYRYVFDRNAPTMSYNNFASYSSDRSYNSVTLGVQYSDDHFTSAHKIYYLIALGDEYLNYNKDTVIAANNVYSSALNLHENISADGIYRVCFVGMDYLDNYSDMTCSNAYHLDITALTKAEVTLNTSGSVNYVSSVNVNIDIDGVDDNVEFACALILKGDSATIEDLTSTCHNGQTEEFTVSAEDTYTLYIYASDAAGNYALLDLDTTYKIDTIAPRVIKVINGNNNEYSNSVTIDLSYLDASAIDTSSLKYAFYLSSYDDSSFKELTSNTLSYPLDYYGVYKLAVRVCDVLNNCATTNFDDSFYIDTGIITLSLLGNEKIEIWQFSNYKDAGASATKGNEGRVVVNIDYKKDGKVNSSKVGTYYITYTAGEGMNEVSVTRTVVVKSSGVYLITFASLFVALATITCLRIFIKRHRRVKIY